MNPRTVGLVVCMPTRGAVSIEAMLCLREHLDGYPNKLLTAFRKPVVEARNQLAKEARERQERNRGSRFDDSDRRRSRSDGLRFRRAQ